METYPLYIIVCSGGLENWCLRVKLKQKWLQISIEITMPLPRLRSIASIYVAIFILNNQYCRPFTISAVQVNNYPFHSYLQNQFQQPRNWNKIRVPIFTLFCFPIKKKGNWRRKKKKKLNIKTPWKLSKT